MRETSPNPVFEPDAPRRCRRARPRALWSAAAAALAAGAAPAVAVETVWFGGGGTWDDAADWSAGQPGAGDVAVINGGSATLSFDTTILGLRQAGGTIAGTGALTVTGASTWTGGTLTGAGSTNFNGALAISGNLGKSITGTRIVNLAGATTWAGNTANLGNTLGFGNGTINNSGTFVDGNTFDALMDTLGATAFNNSGTYHKTGAGTTTIEPPLNNSGNVAVDAGTLRLWSGTSGGSFAIANGARLSFTFGTHTLNSATVSGAGTFEVGGGTVVINGGSHAASLLISAGNLAGNESTFSAAATWTGGTITGAGTTTFAGPLAISGNNGKGLTGTRVLELQGTTTWGGNTGNGGNTIAYNNGTINNHGSFVDSNGFDALIDTLGASAFNNIGSLRKTGAGTTTIEPQFNNTGSVAVDAGTLRLQSGTSSGSFTIASGARTVFVFGTHTLNNATVSGAGTFEVGGGTVVLNGGSYAAPLLVSAGNLAGSESTFSAPATWTGGTITGAGTTTFANTLAISGNNGKGLTGTRVLELQGTTTWGGNTGNGGNTIAYNNGTINNHGSFVDANAFDALIDTLGASAFNNSGSLRKTGAGTTTIEPQFNNSGSVAVDAGTLRLQSGTSSGSFAIANGARTVFVFGTHTLNNATVSGAGTLEVGGANVAVNGGHYSAPLLISAGNLAGTESTFSGPATWTGGTITGAGSTTFAGPLAISGNNGKGLTGTRVLNLQGTTTWSGNTGNGGNTIGFGNGTINNSGTFVDANAFSALMDTTGVTAFNNSGTYRKTGGGTTTIEPPLVNTGLVEVEAGTLNASATFDNLGTIDTAAGATFGATNLSRDLQNHGLLVGNGTYDPAAGRTLLNAGAVDPGSVGGVGHLTVAGNFTQPGGGAFDVDLASLASFDLLSVTDNVTLGGAIVVHNAGYVPVVGDTFVVMTFAQRLAASTFAGVVNQGYGSGTVFEAIYHANDVTLRVAAVPEPAGWVMLLSGLSWVGFALRRRRAV